MNITYKYILISFVSLCTIQHCVQAQIITTYAGNGGVGSPINNVPATSTTTGLPHNGSFDSYGNYYFTTGQSRVRKVSPFGIMTTVVGGSIGGYGGDNGLATVSQIHCQGVHVDSNGSIYIADYYNNRLRKVDALTGVIQTISGNGTVGSSGNGGMASSALMSPVDVITDGVGNIYVFDNGTGGIRKIDVVSGIIDSFCAFGGWLCFDVGYQYLYIAGGTWIRRVSMSTGIVDTVGGTGLAAYNGDEISATSANLNAIDIAVDFLGNIYLADMVNDRIRKIDISGIIHTIAGTGTEGYNGDGIPATSAKLWNPQGLAFDQCSNLYISDDANHRVRKVTFTSTPSTTISISSGISDAVCSGTAVTYTASTTGGGTTFSYQWRVNGAAAGTGGTTYSYTPVNGDSISCTVTTTNACSSPAIANSNTIHTVVNPSGSPAITITSSPGDTVCVGTSVTYTASITNGGTSPAYQWKVNGINVGTGSSYIYTPANSDSIRCVLTSNAPCMTTATASSNSRYMVVNPLITPTISIISSPSDTVCSGTIVTYTASITSGGTSPLCQWKVNGINAGTGASTFSYIPTNGDTVNCVLTSNAACATTTIVNSNVHHMVVNPTTTPTISIISSPGDTVCAGTAVTFTASITGGGTSPLYQWKVNGINAGTGTSTFSYTPANGDTVNCVLTSNAICAIATIVNSNVHHMVVNPLITPTISIISSPSDTVCAGTIVTYTASITGSGTSPAYQWKVNGVNAGTGASTFTYTPANGDTVRCVLTSSAPCTTAATINSNNRNMVVYTVDMPTIAITANPNDTVCTGSIVNFTAATTIGGSSPGYQWKVNGANVGASAPSYAYFPVNLDSVRCILTSSAPCASPVVVSSNMIDMVVDIISTPTITLSGPAAAAIGSTVTITATVTGAGSTYTIYWMNSGTVFTTTSVPVVSYTKLSNNDTITAKIVPTGCYDSTVSAAQIVFNANEGINDPNTDRIELFPNPAGDVLNIKSIIKLRSIIITNLLGQIVLTSEQNNHHAVIDIHHLSKGIYFVKINNEKVVRFVKE